MPKLTSIRAARWCALVGLGTLWGGACTPDEGPDQSDAGGSGGSASGGTGGRVSCRTLVTTLECTSDADCCVVEDSCRQSLQLVTLAEESALFRCLSSDPPPMCPSCMADEVQVSCQNGTCTGKKVGSVWPPTPLALTHCGAMPTGGARGYGGNGNGGAGGRGGTAGGATGGTAPDTTLLGEGASTTVVFGCAMY